MSTNIGHTGQKINSQYSVLTCRDLMWPEIEPNRYYAYFFVHHRDDSGGTEQDATETVRK
jgi:hypothetical protein